MYPTAHTPKRLIQIDALHLGKRLTGSSKRKIAQHRRSAFDVLGKDPVLVRITDDNIEVLPLVDIPAQQ